MDTTASAPPTIGANRSGWRAERRGTPWFGHAIAAGGGALVAIGVVAIGGDVYPNGSDDPGWIGALLCLALIVVAAVALPRVPSAVRSACVAAIAIAVPGGVGFIFFPGVNGLGDVRPFFAVTIVLWLLAFVLGPTRGRTLFFGLALLLAFSWALTEVADVGSAPFFVPPFASSFSSSLDSSSGSGTTQFGDSTAPSPFVTETSKPNWGEMGGVAGGFAAVYLLGVVLLDARGRRGIATAAVLPGVVALVLAVVFLGTEAKSVVVAGLLSVTAGLFCGSVGAQSHRRFTVWTGAFLATVGALLLTGKIADAATNDSNGDNAATIFGLCTIAFGAVMVGVALLVGRVLREPPTGDDEVASLA
ncbi:MAG: hypothetical protein QOI55_1265 [Actinomycetota bacterium]|jgi:hypothetical protein|nr:hypothetical protein [Actinomycetota bacterium]